VADEHSWASRDVVVDTLKWRPGDEVKRSGAVTPRKLNA
jgi:hypothetical protein